MRSEHPSRALRIWGLVVVAWALLPPFVPPELNTELATEVVDHVVPALVVAAVLGYAIFRVDDRLVMFNLGLVIVVAALFMVGTHLPLLAQAARDEVGWAPAIHHSVAPAAVAAYGAAWAWSYRR